MSSERSRDYLVSLLHGTRSGAVTQQRSIPPLIVNQRATTDTTIVNNRLRDLAVVRASHHRG
ncbi:MAG: hypothetical protein NTY67_04825, partial [Cyanobacteria bacterium]|nr:hypothetical protein [Cyanobacteriota bacterium]